MCVEVHAPHVENTKNIHTPSSSGHLDPKAVTDESASQTSLSAWCLSTSSILFWHLGLLSARQMCLELLHLSVLGAMQHGIIYI
jgi:hypothetical protein